MAEFPMQNLSPFSSMIPQFGNFVQQNLPSFLGNIGETLGGMFNPRMGRQFGNYLGQQISPQLSRFFEASPFNQGGYVGSLDPNASYGFLPFNQGGYVGRYGTGGDTVLAHMSPSQADYLGNMYGGSMNPYTGLPEFGFWDKLKSGFSSLVGSQLGNIGSALPGIGETLGSTLGGKLGSVGSMLPTIGQTLGSTLGGIINRPSIPPAPPAPPVTPVTPPPLPPRDLPSRGRRLPPPTAYPPMVYRPQMTEMPPFGEPDIELPFDPRTQVQGPSYGYEMPPLSTRQMPPYPRPPRFSPSEYFEEPEIPLRGKPVRRMPTPGRIPLSTPKGGRRSTSITPTRGGKMSPQRRSMY